MPRLRLEAAGLLTVAAVALAGCGDGEESADAPAPTPTPAAPAPAEPEPEEAGTPAPTEGETETMYEVQRGDTLWDIADRFGTTVDAIVEANGLDDPSRIFPGDELVIPQH